MSIPPRSLRPVLLALVVLAVIPWNPPSSAVPVGSIVAPEVWARVLQAGRARVIVELRLPGAALTPEGLLSSAGVVAQRNDIVAARQQVLARLASTVHRVLRQYDTTPHLALEVGPDALTALDGAAFWVTRVVEDTLHRPSLPQSVPLVMADRAWNAGFDGTGALIAIVDTGVDSSHPFLASKVVEEACYSTTSAPDNSTTMCPNGQSQQLGPGAGVPCPLGGCWHGTHVAGIAAGNGAGAGVTFSGVAKGAHLMSVMVFSRINDTTVCGGAASCAAAWESDIIAGLERVYALRGSYSLASANMSLGGANYTAPCDTDPGKPIIDNLRSVAIATVVAAGNSGATNAISTPACISSAINVGATTKSDVVASFSNVASFMSLFAPGVSIYSSGPGGSFTSASGTSMATPHVAGAWAILKQASPSATVDQVLSAFQTTGVPITDTRTGGTVTKPRINVADALNKLVPGSVPPPKISASPSSVAAGGTVTATWSGIPSPTTTDWIGLYAQGAVSSATPALNWVYVSCSRSPGAAVAAGSCPFTVPSTVTAGSYELRLFAQNGYTQLAVSPLGVTP